MPEIGQTISHYRIVEKIGQGGMGEVYLADDATLDRKVALKFLPEAFTSDPERMARFEREAKLLASLNHPNIAGIHGLEQAEGVRFLVLEYVEGETLQARLSKGALPLEDALALCHQIAEGLEAAHEKGVIHRDLKPANVMITADEKVKILDFGLAKALSDEIQSIDSSQSPTLTEAMTQPGVILGTAAYMSPEQAKGKSVDKRADIWAFSCILYECLTGKKAFEGETVTETLAAILRGEPDWNRIPSDIHPRIRLMLERCLRKEIRNRYGSISDARVDIQDALADPTSLLIRPIQGKKSRVSLRTMMPWLAVTFVIGAVIACLALWKFQPEEQHQVMCFPFELPEGQQIDSFLGNDRLALSLDGRQMVYATNNGLYLKDIDKLESRLVLGMDEGSSNPFFSPDGKWIGYWAGADRKLKKIAVAGGRPQELCDASIVYGATWQKDDTIVYGQARGIMKVSAEGGNPETILEVGNSRGIGHPQILPDGKSLLYDDRTSQPYRVMVYSLESKERKELFLGNTARYVENGYIVYALDSNLRAVPFDTDKVEKIGESRIIQRNVSAQYAVSDSGMLVYWPVTSNQALSERTLVWVDLKGNEKQLSAKLPNYVYQNPRISPDGTRVALDIPISGNVDIRIWDIVLEKLDRLTFNEGADTNPLWTPSGKEIVFTSQRDGSADIYIKAANGMGAAELIRSENAWLTPLSWSGDGKTLIVWKISEHAEFGTISMEDGYKWTDLFREKRYVSMASVSPDGQWLAYVSTETGEPEVYVRPFPDVDSGSRFQVSRNGGHSPLWSPDGRRIFYRNGDTIVAVTVESVPAFNPSEPDTLFPGDYIESDFMGIPWDIHPDGDRFLMMKDIESEESTNIERQKIIFVLNWTSLLKQ